MNAVLPFFAGISLTLLGLWLLRYAANLRRDCLSSLTWPSVQGAVEHSELVCFERRRNNDLEMLDLFLRYRYSVNHTHYTGKNYTLYDSRRPRPEAEKILAALAPGQTVKVYFNPNNPQIAVILPGPRPDHKAHEQTMAWIVLVAGGITTVATFDRAQSILQSLFP